MSDLNVVKFPDIDARDIPKMLRALADTIEAGAYGDAHNLAWAIDCGHAHIEIGLMGGAPEPAATAHFLYALAMRKLESVAGSIA